MTPALHIASDPQGTKKPGPASSSKSSAILSGANRIQLCSIIRHYVNDLSGDRTGVCYPIAETIALAKESADDVQRSIQILSCQGSFLLGWRADQRSLQRRERRPQLTHGVPPARTVCIQVRSMFCPLRITAAGPCSRSRSFIRAASAAAPAPSAQLWVAL